MADFIPPQRKKTSLDNKKLNLSTKCPSADGKISSLIWGIVNNNPRITVFTNDPNDTKDNGRISANLDLPVFFMFLEKFEECIASNVEVKYKLENSNYTFIGGKRSEKPVVVSELWFGKDKDGIMWISVMAANRPKIKFPFILSDFHHLQNADGTPVSASEVSMGVAKAYVNILRNMMLTLACDNYYEAPPRNNDNRRGGNGGGYNRNNSSEPSGGSNNLDDDIPF